MTRYVMEIDLGECESKDAAVQAASYIRVTGAAWRLRPVASLPVIRACGDCKWCARLASRDGVPVHACDHDDAPRSPTPPRMMRVDPNAAPPASLCPLLAGAP